MKVGFDISSLHKMSKGRGIGFYTDYLIDAIKKYTDVEVQTINSTQGAKAVDLIHYPYFDFFRPTLKISPKIPTVVTIHDVIPLLFPKHYPAGLQGKVNLFRQKLSLKKVKAVITDSDSSTQDVIKVFNLPAERISTVHLAPANHFQKLPADKVKKLISKFNLPEKFVLYSGGVNWNKNILTQTRAAIAAGIDIALVGSGFENRDNLNHPELKDFKNFLSEFEKNPFVHILGFVSNEELVALMNASKALLFVSRYEGFGLPILEAQSCSIPVITGNNSSMVEVAGNGAMFVSPDSEDQIKSAITKIITDKKVRNELVDKGISNLKNFSWEKTAIETVKVYKNALS